ncbi:hypothetical protein O152_gp307 [Pseudomonas phage PaBG]|uniref:Uncharacterized protein n=1 Tax=Pseudomonas phage PaBG TaxID=1335230 RepID=S5VZM5_9CAUD|nr:hypothetical protein O152_gp307 [Pseudomonas phage PaBG]AGS82055.1 hypothetical protein PaBG_00179 [Pseudomonas phage PaBG]
MRELKLLRKRVKQAWAAEADLSPNERELHQWQFLSMQSNVPYVVGKGAANTFFYRVGTTGEMTYVMPDEMFAIMDKWVNSSFALFAITKTRDIKDAPCSTDINVLLQKTKDKYVGYFIVGITPDQRVVRLHVLKSGLRKNQWVPFKPKKR